MGDKDEGLANSSLSTSRVPPQDGQKADSMPPNRTLPGNDQQRGLDATEPSAPKPADDRKR
jgi:hypothetical protein